MRLLQNLSVLKSEYKLDRTRMRTKDRADRATVEQVMDPRTRMILFKLLRTGVASAINGCISTGKEANVYHANSDIHGELAIKVYKTSILVFKDRDRYVSGEYRFRNGYSKSNPRKMVKLWAEKELRNLRRLEAANIPCPRAIVLRNHVLVMQFIGEDGQAARRLKDAEISADRYTDMYNQCVHLMRTMYQVCRLVHADLSEYNMLYKDKTLYFIDVSQSVEHDHPSATEFLRMDCFNVNRYFANNGVLTLSTRELFSYVTLDPKDHDDPEAFLEAALQKAKEREAAGGPSQDDIVEEAVFAQAYIPQSLNELDDPERELNRVQQNFQGVAYDTLRNLAVHKATSGTDADDKEMKKTSSTSTSTSQGKGSKTAAVSADDADDAAVSKTAASFGRMTLASLRAENPNLDKEADNDNDNDDDDDDDEEEEEEEEGKGKGKGKGKGQSKAKATAVQSGKTVKMALPVPDDDDDDDDDDDEDGRGGKKGKAAKAKGRDRKNEREKMRSLKSSRDGGDERDGRPDEDEDEEEEEEEVEDEDEDDDSSEDEDGDDELLDEAALLAELQALEGAEAVPTTREEMKQAKKAHKAAVKAENREKRKSKEKKHVKKRRSRVAAKKR